ncbi:hypothetical protein M378DRAFT_172389 [Amanita muscaria Koide BX008]|uniref:Uncharacterized protein n=1 Tax=Amanita muscaria (strain Koide BX008) TaxID=946122 RepID=A0A0C2WKV1_AMAMK|nr:hypothetical protein M378DRAFT_172389 [Amanita muscaria Koide BX008]
MSGLARSYRVHEKLLNILPIKDDIDLRDALMVVISAAYVLALARMNKTQTATPVNRSVTFTLCSPRARRDDTRVGLSSGSRCSSTYAARRK